MLNFVANKYVQRIFEKTYIDRTMESKLKVGIIGYTDIFEYYTRAFEKMSAVSFEGVHCGDEVIPGYSGRVFDSAGELINSVDAVIFLGEKIRKKQISDAIRALKHVFIDDYSAVLSADIETFQRLVEEARTVAQVSMPKMYYWNILEIKESCSNIRHIQFIKEQSYINQRFQVDYIPELVSILKLVDTDVLRAYSQAIPLLQKKVEQVEARLDFSNGVTACISSNPCGFFDLQELRIIAEKSLTMLDLRKREWHSLSRGANKDIQKELINMDEVPFVELNELEDFVASIQKGVQPIVSFGDIKRLYRCLQLMEEGKQSKLQAYI